MRNSSENSTHQTQLLSLQVSFFQNWWLGDLSLGRMCVRKAHIVLVWRAKLAQSLVWQVQLNEKLQSLLHTQYQN